MKIIPKIFFIGVLLLFISCNSDNKSSFSIRDFKKSLQPYLINIVSKGIVGYDTSTRFIQLQTTDEELKQLSQSEHPILRAVAFRGMLERSGFNHFDLLMSHLNDTAIVTVDAGEWGTRNTTISDDIIYHSTWKNFSEKNKTIDTVIINHNYLHSAYTILSDIEPLDKYYFPIKKMAQRNGPFEEIEYTLYALAKFCKKQDIQIIKDQLLTHNYRMGSTSFRLMEEFPNEAYMEVFEKFYQRNFYRSICQDRNANNATEFINSLASYKNEGSAIILNKILNRKPFMVCDADTSYIMEELVYAIWDNKCPSYEILRNQVETLHKNYEKTPGIPMDMSNSISDSSVLLNRW